MVAVFWRITEEFKIYLIISGITEKVNNEYTILTEVQNTSRISIMVRISYILE